MAPPRVVCVVPIYGHSILANEAIGSALDQLSGTSLGVVAVNDGCPARETAELIEGWARAHPGQVVPVHQTNQGLSAARNIGIETALATWPELDAVFFLDADNRLERSAAALFHRLLDEDPAADWFFPNFDFFGIETYAHNGAAYSVARMSASNQCEAGSLLRRRVLDAGLRFNETMRAGYEDWDFWLQASAEGYRGARLTTTVFRYRKRPESMLSGSHAGDTTLREQISSQHRWLYARDGILQAALEEGPFAIRIATEDGRIETLSGPTLAPTTAPLDTLAETLFAALAQRERVRLPPFMLITRPPAEAILGDARLGRGVFCHLQEGLVGADISLLRLGREVQDGNYWFENTRRWPAEWMPDAHAPEDTSVLDAFATAIRPAEALMIRTDRLVAALAERSASGLLTRLVSGARLTILHASLPVPPPASDAPGLAEQLTLTADRLLATRFATPGREAYRPWRWPAEITGPTKLPDVLSRSALNGAPLLLPRRGRPQIGFVLPILKFGGVEKCAVALAAAARTAGADCHLFVYGNQNAAATPWLHEPFETVHFVAHKSLRDWSGPRYIGTNLASRPPEEVMNRILGPLSGLDAVLNSGCAALHHGVGALRRKGVRTIAWEHLVETGVFGRDYGTPYLALAYEGGYDRIAACSDTLATWLAAHGVPRTKLLTLRNGPGFPMAAPAAAEARAVRRDHDGPLRVGFLGRMDSQKGLDRFLAVADAARGLPVSFSVTGKPVLEDEVTHLPEGMTLFPPAYELDELMAAFARIDVLAMPSRDEGLPLTIMEAQRAGVVPVVSRVGAVHEAIEDGRTGFTVDPDNVTAEMLARIRELSSDRAMLTRIAEAGSEAETRWSENARLLLEAIEG